MAGSIELAKQDYTYDGFFCHLFLYFLRIINLSVVEDFNHASILSLTELRFSPIKENFILYRPITNCLEILL